MLSYGVGKRTKTNNKLLGMRIRQARELRGWSQEALADELNVKQTTVARWERGSFPRRIGLPKVAAALDKPVEWFVDEDRPSENMEAIMQRLSALERGQGFSNQEMELIRVFRETDNAGRRLILGAAEQVLRITSGADQAPQRKVSRK